MSEIQPRDVLVSLSQGRFPGSPVELPRESVIHHPDVFRALLVGISALDVRENKAIRRSQLPPKVGTAWTGEEEERLRREFAVKTPLGTMAKTHGRTPNAIEARLQKLGLISAEERTIRSKAGF